MEGWPVLPGTSILGPACCIFTKTLVFPRPGQKNTETITILNLIHDQLEYSESTDVSFTAFYIVLLSLSPSSYQLQLKYIREVKISRTTLYKKNNWNA